MNVRRLTQRLKYRNIFDAAIIRNPINETTIPKIRDVLLSASPSHPHVIPPRKDKITPP